VPAAISGDRMRGSAASEPQSRKGLGPTGVISSPFHVAAYLKALRVSDAGDRAVKERTASRPTVKQHLAAIRMLSDWRVVGQVLAANAPSCRRHANA
jgi:hypothetical protein